MSSMMASESSEYLLLLLASCVSLLCAPPLAVAKSLSLRAAGPQHGSTCAGWTSCVGVGGALLFPVPLFFFCAVVVSRIPSSVVVEVAGEGICCGSFVSSFGVLLESRAVLTHRTSCDNGSVLHV